MLLALSPGEFEIINSIEIDSGLPESLQFPYKLLKYWGIQVPTPFVEES